MGKDTKYSDEEWGVLNKIREYNIISTETRYKCFDIIKDYVKKYGKKTDNRYAISFLKEDGEYIGDNCISVPYNGGNHPEYNSSAAVNVDGVIVDENGISLNIYVNEEEIEYEIYNVPTEDVVALADYMLSIKDELE